MTDGLWERFIVEKIDTTTDLQIRSGDLVSIRTVDKSTYWNSGGGLKNKANAAATGVQSWERFVLTLQ